MADYEKRPLLATKDIGADVLDGAPPAASFAAVAERIWVLCLCSLMAFLQGGIWNTWGPIAPAIEPLLGMEDTEIALLANWGPICYLIFVLPSAWILDIKGLRWAMLVSTTLVFAGSGVRLIDLRDPTYGRYMIHGGQFLNGLAGPVAMSAPPVVSATFFPQNQRTMATSIISISNYLGVAATFFVGPLLIPNKPAYSLNTTLPANVTHTRNDQLETYLIGQTVLAAACFVGTVAYFPARPKLSPSYTATEDRAEFWDGFKQLFRHKDFWLIALSYGFMTGVYSGWGSFLTPNLQAIKLADAQDLASMLGTYATLAGCVAGVGCSVSSDYLGGKLKKFLLALSLGAFACYFVFLLVCTKAIKDEGNVILYLTCIIGGFFLNGTIPLFYEAAVEATYPVAEGSTTCLLTTLNNVGCLLFLFAPNIPFCNDNPGWANWALVGSCAFGFLVLLPFSEKYQRSSVDLSHAKGHGAGAVN